MCISQTILYGVLSSILSVLLITIIMKLRTYFILRKLNPKNYSAYEILDDTLISGYTFAVKVKFRLLYNKLAIKQTSNKFGN